MVVVDSQPQETSASINSKVKGAVPIGWLQIPGLRCSSNGLVCPHVVMWLLFVIQMRSSMSGSYSVLCGTARVSAVSCLGLCNSSDLRPGTHC
jgi:hypothetical protein